MITALSLAHTPRRHEASALPRSLLLAVLVHVWLALLVGNRPGHDRPGSGLWSGLSITLLGSPQATADGPVTETATRWRDDGPLGQARSPRHGGRVRRHEAPPPDQPGAQELGRWQPEPIPRTLQDLDESPARRSERSPSHNLPSPDPALAQLTVPLPTAPSARELPAHLVETGARGEAGSSAAPTARLPRLDALAPAPGTELRTTPAQLQLPDPSPSVRTLAAPAKVRGQRLPDPVTALPSTVREDEESRVVPLPAPSWPRQLEAPAPPERRTRPLPSVPALAAPETAPPLRAQPGTAPALPAAAEPPEAKVRTDPTPMAAPPPSIDSPAPSHTSTPAPTSTPSAGAPSLPRPLVGGDPAAGARVGHDVATAPSASASAPLPPLNLQLPRASQGPTRSGPGLLEWLPAPPERKSKLEKSMDEAGRADCRSAYGAKGLLAAGPLVADAARGKGCKW